MHQPILHPDDETIAEFLDGRLDGEHRTTVLAHLDACPRCFELVAELAAYRSEAALLGSTDNDLGAAPGTATVVAFPTRRADKPPRWQWVAAAAGVALAVGMATWLTQAGQPANSEHLIAELSARPATLARETLVRDDGGVAGFSGRSLEARAVLAGAELVNLAVALRAGTSPPMGCSKLEALVPGVCTNTSTDEAIDLLDLERKLGQAVDPSLVDFGSWLGAVRLAAITADTMFLNSHPPPRALDDPGFLTSAPLERVAFAEAWSRATSNVDGKATAQQLEDLGRAAGRLLVTL